MIFTFLSFLSLAWGLEIAPPTGPVTDQAGLLSSQGRARLESALTRLNASQKVEMGVLVAKDLQGESLEGFSLAVVEKWKLGKKGTDQGLLLLVVPSERALRLEVGYGLEGALPDAVSSRIIRETITPYFRSQQFDEGLLAAVGAVAQRLEVDLGQEIPRPKPQRTKLAPLIQLFFLMLILVAILNGIGGGPWNRRRRGWSSHSGWDHFGGFGGGGFGGGGFGGGGFGGGGGGFGGGGASGRW